MASAFASGVSIAFILPDSNASNSQFQCVSLRPLLDSTEYTGFYISLLDHFCIIFSYYILYVGVSLLHIGFCSHLNAFVEDYTQQMRGLDREVSAQMARNECHAGRMKATLVDAVEMHVKVTRRVLTAYKALLYWNCGQFSATCRL